MNSPSLGSSGRALGQGAIETKMPKIQITKISRMPTQHRVPGWNLYWSDFEALERHPEHAEEPNNTEQPSQATLGKVTVPSSREKKKKTNRGGGQSHISCQSCHGCPTKQTPPTDNQHRAKNPDDISPCDVNVSPTQSFLNVRS